MAPFIRGEMAWPGKKMDRQCNAMRTWQQLLMRAQFLDWGPATDGTGMKLDRVVACPANANACSGGRRGSGNSARIRRVRYHHQGSSTATLSLALSGRAWLGGVKLMGIAFFFLVLVADSESGNGTELTLSWLVGVVRTTR
jgi:hypothetical protein